MAKSVSAACGLLFLSCLVLAGGLGACSDASSGDGEDGLSSSASPLFNNGGFESSDFTAWTKSTFLNNNGLAAVPPASIADLQLSNGGRDFTFVRIDATPQSQLPAGLAAGPGVPLWPRFGTSSAVINEWGSNIPSGNTWHQGANNNVNSIRQSFTPTYADIDPADGKLHVRFVLAPVLEAAGHAPVQQPYFFVVVRNLTAPRNRDLYSNFNFANQAGIPWTSQGSGANALLFTDWQIFDVVPEEDQFQIGDAIEVEVFAAGCEPGGHSGSAYVDGFGAQIPSLAISKDAPASVNIDEDITYTFTVQNNTSGIAPNVTADEELPPHTTFVSLSAPPGATCTTPAVGSGGTVSCTFGWMNPGATETFTVTVHNHTPVSSGTATAANATRLDDTSQAWATNAWQGYTVYITGGQGAGQQRLIETNTATRLNVLPGWTTTPNTTSTYKIIAPPEVLGNATGSTNSSLTQSSATWGDHQWLGWTVSILSGQGAGQQRMITRSTSNQLTISPNWNTRPDGTSVFAITRPVTSVVNGNYGVRGPTVTRLLGPARETKLTTGVVYTDLSLTKTDSVPGVIWGGNVTYQITVVNNGPSAVDNARVTDTFPPELATPTWTCAASGGGNCDTTSGSNDINHTVDLPVGASATFTVNATVVAGTGNGTVTNAARVALPAGVTDSFPGNNVDSDQDGISTTLHRLTVTKDPAGTGQGTVTSSPAAIACGPACASANADFAELPEVTLHAVAVANHRFVGWSGDCTGSAPTCTLSMTAARNVTVLFTECGNGALDATEGCDDGNLGDGDGCSATCRVETTFACNGTAPGLTGGASCASGVCDATGGAPGICEAADTCGNAALEAGEGCDDGNTTGGDGCSATCRIEDSSPCNASAPGLIGGASCASGVCDATGGAPGVCEAANACGNSVLEAGEGCDDGNTTSGDGCSATCRIENDSPCNGTAPGLTGNASCASGVCDVSPGVPGVCEAANACGNSVREAGEGCDDGNTVNGDGCSAACRIENSGPCNASAPGLTGSASCASGVCDVSGGAPGVCEAANACGNSVLEAGEGCDDGNTTSGDGCNATCRVETTRPCNGTAPGLTGSASCASGVCDATGGAPGVCEAANACGNSVRDAGEGCDDGNTVSGDGCSATCRIENSGPCNASAPGLIGGASCASGVCDATGGAPGVCEAANACGNSALEAGEGCDDGNTVSGDGCSATCRIENSSPCNASAPGLTGSASCASGVCDATGGAPGVCEGANACGNSVREAGEGCDDGNTVNGDGCSATCRIENSSPCNASAPGLTGSASCASGVCDVTGGAPGVCEAANACGNSVLEAGEGCDDGNTASGDGCNATCRVETTRPCNGTAPGLTGSASCASGVCDATGGAPGVCEAANACGNSVRDAGEGCDDGNTVSGDGCSATCRIEDNSPCNASAPGLTGSASCASGVCDATGGAPGVCEAANACGNSALEAGEGCDDGNTVNGDGCSATCRIENDSPCNGTAPGLTGNASCASGVCDISAGAPGVCEQVNACGNSVLEVGEGCDDGNTASGDGCDATCRVELNGPCNAGAPGLIGNASCASGVCDASAGAPGRCELADTCGNAVREAGEGCDDGNTVGGDGCNASCRVEDSRPCNGASPGLTGSASCASLVCDASGGAPGVCEPANTCGNSVLEAGEGCDDGNTANGDGCNATCRVETGDACNAAAPGLIGASSCASGLCNVAGGAPGVCEAANQCGNSALEAGEGCDDGNTAGGDGCNASCLVENTHPCNTNSAGDVGSASCATSICDTTGGAPGVCELPDVCGNSVLEAGEGCDDGNTIAGDGCDAVCKVETTHPCNGASPGLVGGASCATGVCDSSEGASGRCEAADVCGNSVLDAGEGCDDGNTGSGDGCDAACKVETTHPCNAAAPGLIGSPSCASAICDATGGAPGVCEDVDVCGNSVLESGEGCDDGNVTAGDGCDATCKVETTHPCNAAAPGLIGSLSCASTVCDTTGGAPGVCKPSNACGNSVLDAGEGCDDGNTTAGDGCDAACKVETTHPCNTDAAGQVGDDSCASGVCDASAGAPGTCEAAGACGNAVLEAGEGCDDGNLVDGDGCDAACKVETSNPCNSDTAGQVGNASCASGICDASAGAPGTCEAAGACGNSVLEAGEGCDDGDTTAGDGCDATCKVETSHPCNTNAVGQVGNASCASGICDASAGAPGVCEAANACGNAVLETGEGCDDGNLVDGDGCDATCKVETSHPCNADAAGQVGNASCANGICDASAGAPGTCEAAGACGNSVLEAGEGCDDGNTTAGDGCDAACKVETTHPCNGAAPGLLGNDSCAGGLCNLSGGAPGVCVDPNVCGNGLLEAAEGCDDGNLVDGDGCNAACKVEDANPCNGDTAGLTGNLSCASGVCDATGGAPGVCEAANACGNGVLETTEGCDDGNTTAGDGCDALCKVEDANPCNATAPGLTGNDSCASGVCDATGGAPGVCEAANTCGNGALEANEGCDDGNTTAGDGCNAVCRIESASPCNETAPGLVGNDSCASGLCDTSNGQPGVCRSPEVCGNGELEPGEGCDDGNATDGDGCNAACRIENDKPCNGSAPGLTGNASCASGHCDTTGGAPGTCEATAACGNAVIDDGEGCDDGNVEAGDGCDANCLIEVGAPCTTEEGGVPKSEHCASAVCDLTSGAPGNCEPANACGNGLVEAGETCDDGNTADGDACPATCVTVEFGSYAGGGCGCSSTDSGGMPSLLLAFAMLGLLRRRSQGAAHR